MDVDYEVLMNTEFIEALKYLVERAKQRVYIATYLATRTPDTDAVYYALARKRREGVDVKFLLDGVSQEAKKYNSPTVEFLSKLGVPVKLTEKFMHIKLYIVDSSVILGSHNLTGKPKFKHYELSVAMKSRLLADRFSRFFSSIYSSNHGTLVFRDTMEDGTYFEVFGNYPRMLADIYEKTLYAGKRVKILMFMATLSRKTRKYYELLAEKQREGVDVTVVLDGVFKSSTRYNVPVYEYLRSLGVRATLSRFHVHAKAIVIDDFVILGSHNLSSSSAAGRLELVLAIRQPGLASSISALVNSVYEESSTAHSTN